MSDKKVLVRQTRSANRRPEDQINTLKSLGLGKIGRECEHTVTPSVVGMLKKVSHLVVVKEL